ncbi:MAG TPA: DUF5335 family protein [Thermoanaerobaculia bacterium]|nr:DUF5335 family protein [Thermoanaerobaculia bacterium]
MTNRNVPRAEWYRFFEDFTRRHREELVSVTVVGEKLGAQHEARELPLNGIVADRFGRKLSIALGGATGANIDHPVEMPLRVWVEVDGRGNEIALEIESDNGLQTIVELPLAARRR